MFSLLSKPEWDDVWQDLDVRVDETNSGISLRKGERIIDTIADAEDIKGGNGWKGTLSVTNLRLRWQSTWPAGINVTVGWGTVQTLTTRTVQSKVRGDSHALVISAKSDGDRLEFIFAVPSGESGSGSGAGAGSSGLTGAAGALAGAGAAMEAMDAAQRLFANAQGVQKAYESSRLCRDLRLRGALVRDKAAILLTGERLISVNDGVWNLSSDQGNLGVLTITDRRLVWHASMAENFNVSVPYNVLKDVRVRDSKFGRALVLEVSPRGGEYLLGFRADPAPRLEHMVKEIGAMRAAALANPDYGVAYTPVQGGVAAGAGAGGAGKGEQGGAAKGAAEDLGVDDGGGAGGAHARILGGTDVFAAYYASMRAGQGQGGGIGGMGGGGDDMGHGRTKGPPSLMFAPSLGLAVEQPPPGLTLDTLWSAV